MIETFQLWWGMAKIFNQSINIIHGSIPINQSIKWNCWWRFTTGTRILSPTTGTASPLGSAPHQVQTSPWPGLWQVHTTTCRVQLFSSQPVLRIHWIRDFSSTRILKEQNIEIEIFLFYTFCHHFLNKEVISKCVIFFIGRPSIRLLWSIRLCFSWLLNTGSPETTSY